MTLLALSAGSLLALPAAGRIVSAMGVATSIRAGMVAQLCGAVVIGLGADLTRTRMVIAVGLFFVGLGIGLWDVAMNLEGAAVERLLGRSTMPHYHAAFSGGTVLSALAGAAMSWQQVPIMVHLVLTGTLVLVIGVWALRATLPPGTDHSVDDLSGTTGGRGAEQRSAWLEPRTILVGVVVLSAAFAEGTANDWLSVALVEGHDLPRWAGVLGLATFLSFMTAGRLLGTRLLDRYGRVRMLRATFALAVGGSLIVVYGPAWLAYVGAAIWGVGACLGFPVGMSASADRPSRAPARMSVVATLGYTAFIAGPPLLGFLGDQFGVRRALLAVTVLMAMTALVIPAVGEPTRAVPTRARAT